MTTDDTVPPPNKTYKRINLAILKGIVEHRAPGAYLASFLALNARIDDMQNVGWLDVDLVPTSKGMEIYRELELCSLPNIRIGSPGAARWYLWNWGDRDAA